MSNLASLSLLLLLVSCAAGCAAAPPPEPLPPPRAHAPPPDTGDIDFVPREAQAAPRDTSAARLKPPTTDRSSQHVHAAR